MGVSTGSDNADLSIAMDGGPGFIQRLEELRTTTANFQKALADLNLGKAAQDAMNDASSRLAVAKEQIATDRAAFDNEVSKARSDLTQWVEGIRAATLADRNAASDALAAATDRQDRAQKALDDAQATLRKATEDAAKMVADARDQATQIVADAEAEADNLKADAEKLKKDLRAALDAANASKAKYDAALAKIQAAIIPSD